MENKLSLVDRACTVHACGASTGVSWVAAYLGCKGGWGI